MLFALFAGVFRYVDQHFHNPDKFFENNSDLAFDADIRQHLFDGFRDQIISIANGDSEVDTSDQASGLPDLFEGDDSEADEIDPVTAERNERNGAIERILGEAFDSTLYFDTFNAALVTAQVDTIRAAELEPSALLRDKGDIVFDMRTLYRDEIQPALSLEPLTTTITQTPYPDDHGRFKIADRSTTIDLAWTMIQKGPGWRTFSTFMAVLCLVGALVLADRRPSTAIQFGGGMAGLGVVAIVIVYLIRFIVPVLAGGSGSASAVVATYASNTSPLVGSMVRLVILGAVLAAVGGIAKLIWPDDWVYSSVSGEGGVRSVRRRRGAPAPQEPAPAQPRQVPVAAAVPVGYPGYPQPHPGYPQQWGQPYPAQYPPGYPAPYPVGPYAQPQQAQPASQHYTSPGRPTVPVNPVQIDGDSDDLVPPAAPPHSGLPTDLPEDAAQAVPRVVATTSTTLDASKAKATVVEPTSQPSDTEAPTQEANDVDVDDDQWATEKDW